MRLRGGSIGLCRGTLSLQTLIPDGDGRNRLYHERFQFGDDEIFACILQPITNKIPPYKNHNEGESMKK